MEPYISGCALIYLTATLATNELSRPPLNNIPKGIVKFNNQKIILISKLDLKKNMESLINHFKFYTEGFNVLRDSTYVGTEAPKGEFGVFIASNNNNKPYRCKIKAPGFAHLQGLNFITKGYLIADVSTIIGTLDIVFGEVDR